jgi:hypothetical protein
MYSFLFIQLNLSLKKKKFEPLLVNILTKPCSYNDKNVKSWQNISSSTETGQKYFVYLFQAKISNNSQIGLGYSQKLRDGKLSIIISIVKGLGLWCLMPLSVILWRSVLLVEETKSSQRNPLTCRKSLTNLYHIMLYRVHLAWAVFELTMLVVICSCKLVICTYCTGSCISNYHMIMTTTSLSILILILLCIL